MVELVEYTLVVLSSTLLITGSVLVYDGYASSEATLIESEAFSTLVAGAKEATWNGTDTLTVVVPSAVVACSDETLSLNASGSVDASSIGVPCAFSYETSAGVHTFQFDYNLTLTLLVT